MKFEYEIALRQFENEFQLSIIMFDILEMLEIRKEIVRNFYNVNL